MEKIVNSLLRPEIDKLLLDGQTVYQVETWCRENGLMTSASSLKRYADFYLAEWQYTKKPAKVQSKDNKSDSEITDKICKVTLPKIETSQQFNQIISENLQEIIVNLITVVNVKIREYSLDNDSLPTQDINSLEKIVSIFNQITSKLNESRAGRNIFDVTEALERDEKRPSDVGLELKSYLSSIGKENSETVED